MSTKNKQQDLWNATRGGGIGDERKYLNEDTFDVNGQLFIARKTSPKGIRMTCHETSSLSKLYCYKYKENI